MVEFASGLRYPPSMCKRAAIVIGLATLLGAAPAVALASTATIVAPSVEPRTPMIPLSVADVDYPLASLVANEHGRTVLDIFVRADGRVTDAKVSTSSGHRRLDEAAVEIAKTQWVFWPKEGAATSAVDTTGVNVEWVLPLEELSGSSPAATPNAASDQPDLTNGVAPTIMARVGLAPDMMALIPRDGAMVRMRVLVGENGKPTDVEVAVSSGVPRLDEGTRQLIIDGWVYRPATRNGVPIASWVNANMRFEVSQNVVPPKECRTQPLLTDERAPRVSLLGSLTLRRQVLADESGRIQNALLLTQKGWMKLPAAMLQLNHPMHYEPKPNMNGVPARCWYDADITIRGQR